MKIYKNILNLLTIIFIFIYPLIPSYGKIGLDYLLMLIILIHLVDLILFKEERTNFKKNLSLFKEDKILLTAILLNLLMYISLIYSVDRTMTLLNSYRFTFFIGLYLIIGYKIREKGYLKLLISGFLSASVITTFYSFYQSFKIIEQNLSIDRNHRITSLLENSNILGAYSIFPLFIFVMLAFSAKKVSQKWLFSICTILLTGNIILSQSRNALLGLILGFILIAFFYNKKFIIPSLIICLGLFLIPESQERLVQVFDMSQNSSRLKIWQTTNLMIKDKPLLGSGYETYGTLYPIYLEENPDLIVRPDYISTHPHNVLLKFQSELGILGTILIISFIVVTALTLIRQIKLAENSISKSILTGITIAFIVFNFMNLLDSYYNVLKTALTLFIVLGISKKYFSESESENKGLNFKKNKTAREAIYTTNIQ